MRFQTPLIPARLIRRYKRFLADCLLDDGRQITAHVANPGAMLGLKDEGTRIWLEPNDDPKRKLRFAWRLVEHATGQFTGVDTGVPNRMLRAALEAGEVPGLPAYTQVRPEVRYGENSRIDFLLTDAGPTGAPDTYVEVKSVTLSRQPGLAEFPDCVTKRGAKHLAELTRMTHAGHHAVMVYLVQRTDCDRVTLAADLDATYAKAFVQAHAAGLSVLCFNCQITPQAITLGRVLPFLPQT